MEVFLYIQAGKDLVKYINMLSYSFKKQFIFGALFLIIAAVILSFSYYFLKPEPSCFDGILNQSEVKTDCGGSCQACKPEIKIQDLEIISYNSFFLGNGKYDAMAQVKNLNPAHGAKSFIYRFKFYNSAKEQIAEKSGTEYILANQTKYIIESNIDAPEEAAFTDFSIDRFSVEWIEQDEALIALPVFSKKYEVVSEKGIEFAQVVGTVNNPASSYGFAEVDVHIILVDADKKPIAAGKTTVNNLRSGENRLFTVIFSKDTPLPADIYAEAVANIFNEANVK